MLCVLYFTCILFLFFAVTVCECHIEIKGYLLTYLLQYNKIIHCMLSVTFSHQHIHRYKRNFLGEPGLAPSIFLWCLFHNCATSNKIVYGNLATIFTDDKRTLTHRIRRYEFLRFSIQSFRQLDSTTQNIHCLNIHTMTYENFMYFLTCKCQSY